MAYHIEYSPDAEEHLEEPEPVIYIRAVGIKERNRVRIGKEVIEL